MERLGRTQCDVVSSAIILRVSIRCVQGWYARTSVRLNLSLGRTKCFTVAGVLIWRLFVRCVQGWYARTSVGLDFTICMIKRALSEMPQRAFHRVVNNILDMNYDIRSRCVLLPGEKYAHLVAICMCALFSACVFQAGPFTNLACCRRNYNNMNTCSVGCFVGSSSSSSSPHFNVFR